MAADFIGSHVLVTLLNPANVQVRGEVANIVEHELWLTNVVWLADGRLVPSLRVSNANLADLEVVPAEEYLPATRSGHKAAHNGHQPRPRQQNGPQASTSKQASQFVDPAILSVGKPPSKASSVSNTISPTAQTPSISIDVLFEAARRVPTSATPDVPVDTKPVGVPNKQRSGSTATATATLSAPFDDLSLGPNHADLESEAAELGSELPQPASNAAKRSKRAQRGKKRPARNGQESVDLREPVSPEQVRAQPAASRSRKRIQNQAVEADSLGIEMLPSQQQAATSSRKQRLKVPREDAGWATEDATDIQELGDFDFASNHAKFNKSEIFAQLHREDKVLPEARLVGHNRLPKLGTSGGKNLHWTENVLESPKLNPRGFGKWTSEADESEVESMGVNDQRISSRGSSRRNLSRANERQPSRRSSAKNVDSKAGTGSKLLPAFNNVRQASFEGSPQPRKHSSSPYLGVPTKQQPAFRMASTSERCPVLSPLQMVELEQHAITELNLTEDILTENAARAIAETTILPVRMFPDPKSVAILVIAGNHKTGARAIAAARHLRNHGYIHTTTTLLGMDRDGPLLDVVAQQLLAYERAGGTVLRPTDLIESLPTLNPKIVVDAVLGIHTDFEDLRRDDQAWLYEIILSLTNMGTEVLSIDVPAGVNGSTGEILGVDDKHAAFNPRYILSLGAPKTGLLKMRAKAEDREDGIGYYVADIGISNVAWKGMGKGRSRGIEFGQKWVVEMAYHH